MVSPEWLIFSRASVKFSEIRGDKIWNNLKMNQELTGYHLAHTWGVNSSYGVFLAYYLNNNYFPNTSALTYAFIGGLSISQAMMIAPLATHVIHLYGTRVCLHLGVFFETLSLIGASFATQKYQLILSQGVCFGWGMGFLL